MWLPSNARLAGPAKSKLQNLVRPYGNLISRVVFVYAASPNAKIEMLPSRKTKPTTRPRPTQTQTQAQA